MTETATEEIVSKPGPWVQVFSPKGFEWNRVMLPIADLPSGLDGFRIIHLTDLHFRNNWPWYEAYDELLAKIKDAQADAVFITGDFVDNKRNHLGAIATVKRFINSLESRLGTYGILGNHDGPKLAGRIENENITLLDHQRFELETGTGVIELIALVGLKRYMLREEFVARLPGKQAGVPRIVLSHYPDSIRKAESLEADVFLCGHTHGGQVCLPGGVPIISHDRLPKKYCKGVHRWNEKTWLVVNKGFGFSGFLPMRVFCPAEAIEITLTRA